MKKYVINEEEVKELYEIWHHALFNPNPPKFEEFLKEFKIEELD